MKRSQMKEIAKRADKAALRIDVSLITIDKIIKMTKEDAKKNDDKGMYLSKLLGAVRSLLNEEIEELYQMKYDINKMLEKRK